jgi:3',5'-cyclic-AMP phosphodiesterase
MTRRMLASTLLFTAAGCVHVADDRADRDLTVGKASIAGASVDVADGLSAVRSLSPRSLHLWAGAPAVTAHLHVGAETAGRWTVRLENTLFDAIVEAKAGGSSLAIEEQPPEVRTDRTFFVELAEGDTDLTIVPPEAEDISPFRFAIYADVQEAIDRVQDIYRKMNEDPTLRFALITGDLTSQGKPEQLERFQREMRTLTFPCYATIGNHELGTRDDLFQEYFGRASYRFWYRRMQFLMVDSASATVAPKVYDWLDGWLGEHEGSLRLAIMHIPPIDPVGERNGSFASRAEAAKLLGTLHRGGVDLTVYGHVHSYYAFENAGIPAYISGGGGAIPERLDGIGRHFLVVTADPAAAKTEVTMVRVD